MQEAALKFSYRFKDPQLLQLALTHRSVSSTNNERLEFLGDAALDAIISEFLYQEFPNADEGELTRTRASLVKKETLAKIARELDLGGAIRLGEGELKSGGWRRASILANTLEALIGAILLDGGEAACREQVLIWYADLIADIDPSKSLKDPKTQLQEALQALNLPLPIYETVDVSGPAHNQTFTISCRVGLLAEPIIEQEHSRRRAEQKAAAAALSAIAEIEKMKI